MTAIAIMMFCAFFVLINRKIYGRFVCFPSVITAIWCVSLALSTLGLYETYPPSSDVVMYALLFVGSINFFSAIFSRLIRSPKNVKEQTEKNIARGKINRKLISAILIVCTVLLLIIMRQSIAIFLDTYDFSDVRNAYLNYDSIGMHAQVLLTITLMPIGRAASILAVIDFVDSKKIKAPFVWAIVYMLATILTTGGRGAMFFLVLTMVVALYDVEKNIFKALRQNKRALRLCLAAIVVLAIVTFQRGFFDNSVLRSIYVYFVGCFNLFGVYFDSAVVPFVPLLYGQVLVSGFSFPFIEVLRYVFNVDILPGNYIISEDATAKYINISPQVAINATPTTMYFAMRDFSVPGLIIYPMAICYAFQKIKNWRDTNGSVLSRAIFANFICSALLLSMGYQFGTFQCIAVFMFLYGIDKISRGKIKIVKEKNEKD